MTPEQQQAIKRAQQQAAIKRAQAAVGGQSAPKVPEGYFLNPETGQMTNREMLASQVQPNAMRAASDGYLQGYTFNTFDEAMGAAGQAAGGADEARFRREQARARFEAAKEQNPIAYTVGNVAGAITNPVMRLFGPVRTVKGAAGVAGVEGALSGAGDAEGGVAERAAGAAQEGALSALFGAGTGAAMKYGSRGFRRLFARTQERPTLGNLKAAKNAAYSEVRQAGIDFQSDDIVAAWNRLDDLARDPRWDLDPISEVDKAAFDALRTMQRRAEAGRPISLNNLDKTRQKMWDIYSKSDHPYVLQVIEEIDGLIAAKAEGNELMQAARVANQRASKAELLENAFKKARLQTAATGSGGNILNKYRQAITRIITTPREAKWFSPEEIALMEQFVTGGDVENTLRRAGKLAPGGNGLMTALNVYAAAVDPTMLAISGAATAAKEGADRSAMRGSEGLLDAVSTGVIPTRKPDPNLRNFAIGAGAAGGS